MPKLHQLPSRRNDPPRSTCQTAPWFEEYADLVNQISISHHYHIDGDRVRTASPSFRYVWPSELDLMAQLAGMELESRWADWNREPFTASSPSHVSVWRKL